MNYYKTTNYKEYIFINIIISLSILNLVGIGIKLFYNYIKSKIEKNGFKYNFYLKIYSILTIEFIFILTLFNLGVYFKIPTIFYENLITLLITFISLIYLICISFIILLIFEGKIKDFIVFFIFTFCVVISQFLLSKYLDKNIILYFLIIILSNAITIEIYLIFNCSNKIYEIKFLIISLFVMILTIFLLYKFWIKESKDIIYISIFGIILFLLNNICHFLLFNFYTFDNALFQVLIMHFSLFALIYMLIYKIQKRILSTISPNKKMKLYLCILNLFLLAQYIVIAYFVFKFNEANETIHESFSNNIIYYLIIFAFPPFLFYCPLFINKKNDQEWNIHYSLCFYILCYIINMPIMIYFYLFLLYYLGSLNLIYLFSFIIILFLTIEMYSSMFRKFSRILFILIPLITCLCTSLLFYNYYSWKISIISYVLAALYFINVMVSENILSKSCNCSNNGNSTKRENSRLKFYDIFYSIAFINLMKYSPLSLIYIIPFDILKKIIYNCFLYS